VEVDGGCLALGDQLGHAGAPNGGGLLEPLPVGEAHGLLTS
jgi:hypothetical protein